MKINRLLITPLLFVLVAGDLYAQYGSIEIVNRSPFRVVRLPYTNSAGEKGVSVFEYDDKGMLKSSEWKQIDNSRSSQNTYTLDEQGRVTRKFRQFSDGIRSTQIYTYNERGNLSSVRFERSDGVKGTTGFTYDPDGKLIEADCQGLNGWFFGKLIYGYDDKGVLTHGDIMQKGSKTGTIVYEYDASSNPVKEHWDFIGSWNQTFVYEYERALSKPAVVFSSSNVFITQSDRYRVSHESYDFNNESGGPSLYYYGDDGKLEKKVYKTDDFETHTTFEYNDTGLLTRSFRNYSNDLKGEFSYTFNPDRRLKERRFKRSDGVTGKELYEYDDKGRLARAIYENFDTWLTGTIAFEYDGDGYLSRGHFKGKDSFDAELTFAHDEHGNTTRIHWEFSFGKTQTYRFEYEALDKESGQ
ncbi:MAG: hypothetical protein ABIK28_14890 [Planctomycetota bacterium]